MELGQRGREGGERGGSLPPSLLLSSGKSCLQLLELVGGLFLHHGELTLGEGREGGREGGREERWVRERE